MAYIREARQTQRMTSTFSGLDKRERIADGAWNDMLNMTVENYPCAASRNKRAIQLFAETVTENDMTVKKRASSDYRIYAAQCEDGVLRVVEGKSSKNPLTGALNYSLRYRENGRDKFSALTTGIFDKVENFFAGNSEALRTGIVINGRDVFLHPYGYFTKKAEDNELHSVQCFLAGGVTELAVTDGDSVNLSVTSAAEAPANPSNGLLWYDTVSKGLYKYSAESRQWVAWSGAYLKLTRKITDAFGIVHGFDGLNVGDAVTVSGTGKEGLDSSFIIHSMSENKQSILVQGYVDDISGAPFDEIVIKRKDPRLQYACSWKNRIWGCHYGEYDGQFVNEIYGSALGDLANFFRYEGTAADSYTVSVGSGGKFTGIAQLEDCVVFFKEDRYYILTGSEPPFSLNEYSGAGIQDGSSKSTVVINGYIYYKSYGGIMRMSPDSRPVRVSDALGVDKWENAVAGTDGEKYYVSMQRTDNGKREFFVYDTITGLWTQEENPFVGSPAAILRYRNSAFAIGSVSSDSVKQIGNTTATGEYTPIIEYLDAENVNKLTVEALGGWSSEEAENESDVMWHADSGTLGLDNPDAKFIRQIQIRGKLADNAMISIEMSYDGHDDEKEPVYLEEGDVKGTFNAVHTPARRCDNFRLHFSGRGKCVIYSVTVTTEDGEDYVQR